MNQAYLAAGVQSNSPKINTAHIFELNDIDILLVWSMVDLAEWWLHDRATRNRSCRRQQPLYAPVWLIYMNPRIENPIILIAFEIVFFVKHMCAAHAYLLVNKKKDKTDFKTTLGGKMYGLKSCVWFEKLMKVVCLIL